MIRYLLIGPLVFVALWHLVGCATIVEGASQVVRIETDPPGASCSILRDGLVVSSIPSTPATISLFKDNGELSLQCNKPGYLDVESKQSAEFSGMTFGNILFGGLIGVAIDAGSGATHKYPAMVMLTLIPERFHNAEKRDAFFAALTTRVKNKYRQVIVEKREQCVESDCSSSISRLESSLDKTLKNIRLQHQQAKLKEQEAGVE